MRHILSKIIRKKNKGQGDLICSLFVITALIAVLFLTVGIVKDISKVTVVDQAARQGIIKLEIKGTLSEDELGEIRTGLENAGMKFDGSHTLDVNGQSVADGVYVVYKNDTSSNKWTIDVNNTSAGENANIINYGTNVAISIQCQAKTFSFGGNIFGGSTSERYTTITRMKASITKKAN